jgi:uncharacterized surface protein with fasciclin (FAS1) repeats
MRHPKTLLSLSLAAGLALGAAPLFAGDTTSPGTDAPVAPTCPASTCSKGDAKDIVDTAVAAGSFTTLVTAVKAADLVEVLKGDGPFTVFAPNDAAFAKVPGATLADLLANKAELAKVLTYHVVPGRVMAADVVKLDWAPTASGSALRVEVKDGAVMVDGAKVIATDIETSNGVIHVIDSVVLPRKDIVATAIGAGSFSTLVTAVKAAGLVETLQGNGPFTVFAPSDAAFAKVPGATLKGLLADKAALTKVLTYHVVPGRVLAKAIAEGTSHVTTVQGQKLEIVRTKKGEVTVNGARVVAADVLAGNGVIHVIDTVVLPN